MNFPEMSRRRSSGVGWRSSELVEHLIDGGKHCRRQGDSHLVEEGLCGFVLLPFVVRHRCTPIDIPDELIHCILLRWRCWRV